MKNYLMLGTFLGYSKSAVEQDIYINLLFYNLQTIAQIEAEKQLFMLNKRRKNTPSKTQKQENQGYQINRNIGANTLRTYLSRLFTCSDKSMAIYFLQSLEKIKPHQRERVRKKIRQNDRHHTELNYKRAF